MDLKELSALTPEQLQQYILLDYRLEQEKFCYQRFVEKAWSDSAKFVRNFKRDLLYCQRPAEVQQLFLTSCSYLPEDHPIFLSHQKRLYHRMLENIPADHFINPDDAQDFAATMEKKIHDAPTLKNLEWVVSQGFMGKIKLGLIIDRPDTNFRNWKEDWVTIPEAMAVEFQNHYYAEILHSIPFGPEMFACLARLNVTFKQVEQNIEALDSDDQETIICSKIPLDMMNVLIATATGLGHLGEFLVEVHHYQELFSSDGEGTEDIFSDIFAQLQYELQRLGIGVPTQSLEESSLINDQLQGWLLLKLQTDPKFYQFIGRLEKTPLDGILDESSFKKCLTKAHQFVENSDEQQRQDFFQFIREFSQVNTPDAAYEYLQQKFTDPNFMKLLAAMQKAQLKLRIHHYPVLEELMQMQRLIAKIKKHGKVVDSRSLERLPQFMQDKVNQALIEEQTSRTELLQSVRTISTQYPRKSLTRFLQTLEGMSSFQEMQEHYLQIGQDFFQSMRTLRDFLQEHSSKILRDFSIPDQGIYEEFQGLIERFNQPNMNYIECYRELNQWLSDPDHIKLFKAHPILEAILTFFNQVSEYFGYQPVSKMQKVRLELSLFKAEAAPAVDTPTATPVVDTPTTAAPSPRSSQQ